MYAKEAYRSSEGKDEEWTGGRMEEARGILERAHQQNSASEEIWMAAMKIEFECREYERARVLLAHARTKCHTARVWMKSAKLERVLGDRARERELIDDGLRQWPDAWKMWLMKAQALQRDGDAHAVRDAYKQAVKHCPHVAVLWVEYAKFEMSLVGRTAGAGLAAPSVQADGFVAPAAPVISAASALSKARAILETARLKIPNSPVLWLTAIRIEAQPSSASAAQSVSSASPRAVEGAAGLPLLRPAPRVRHPPTALLPSASRCRTTR